MTTRDLLPFYLTLFPLRLVSEANMHEHWRTRNKRRNAQRQATYYWLRHWMPRPPSLPLTITLTRIGPRLFDIDNNVASFKACQDGCADWLDQALWRGQDRRPGLVWCYAQRRGKAKEYAVEIQIEATETLVTQET